MARSRIPFIGEIVDFPSPEDPDVTFGIKRLATRDVMSYRDKNSIVRFIQRDGVGGEEFIQEKDYPAGTMRVDTVQLGLASWNITDENGKPVDITRENILAYVTPVELDEVFKKVHEINPILAGETATKNA